VAEKEEKNDTGGARKREKRKKKVRKKKIKNKERGAFEKDLSYPHALVKQEKERIYFF